MQRVFKDMMVLFLGAFSLIYLMYPSFGMFELIPDAIPLIGSIDEAGATILLMNVLNYYNIDVTNLFDNQRRKKRSNSLPAPKSNQRNPDDQ
ncbi:MAG: DUF1232 domain-containing protein [Aggregatilineales bacterium]